MKCVSFLCRPHILLQYIFLSCKYLVIWTSDACRNTYASSCKMPIMSDFNQYWNKWTNWNKTYGIRYENQCISSSVMVWRQTHMRKPACTFLQLFIIKAPKASIDQSEVSTENCLDCLYLGFRSCDMWWCVTGRVVPGFLKDCSALFFTGPAVPWRRRHFALQDIRNPSQQHIIIPQKTWVCSNSAVRTSNLTYCAYSLWKGHFLNRDITGIITMICCLEVLCTWSCHTYLTMIKFYIPW